MNYPLSASQQAIFIREEPSGDAAELDARATTRRETMKPLTGKIMIRLATAGLGLVVATCSEREAQAQTTHRRGNQSIPVPIQKQLREANEHFAFRGKPINPLAIHELLPWLSDTLPGPVAVDIAGTYGSNRYSGQYTKGKDGTVSIDLKAEGRSSAENGPTAGYLRYKRLGVLANGIQVLRTWENAGGSGLFNSLLLVRCVVDYEYTGNGSRRYRLVLWRVGECTLGDRYDGLIEVRSQSNRIRIGADGRNVKKPRVWHIE
jgi:hypothetical protein